MGNGNEKLAILENWEFIKSLPCEVKGFNLLVDIKKVNDEINIFSYECKEKRKIIKCFYNCATKDYMIKYAFGLNEYCEMEFITPDLKEFERLLVNGLSGLLNLFSEFNRDAVRSILVKKGLLDWEYGKSLEKNIFEFELYVKPFEPVNLISGLVVIIDYSDFTLESQFVVYYNMLRDEFYAEKKIAGVIYTLAGFESKNLEELEEKLKEKLEGCLSNLRYK